MTTGGSNLGRAVLELGTDNTGLQKGLDKAQKSAGERMKKIGKIMSVAVTGPILGIGAAVFHASEEIDEAMATIRTGTGATGSALMGLRGDFEAVFGAVPATAQEVASVLSVLHTEFGLVGEELQEAAIAALELTDALNIGDPAGLVTKIANAMDIFNIEGTEFSKVLDAMFVATQQMNVPIGTLASVLEEFGPVLRNLNFTFPETIAYLTLLESNGISVSRVMPGLNAYMRRLAAEGVTDMKGALFDLITNLIGAEDG